MHYIVDDYLAETPALMAAFDRPPRALFEAAPESRPWDPALVEALRDYQAELGGQARFSGSEAVIVTGQQPGLFTGPLYTIYKAATALFLAREVHRRLGVACVPVFWVASDDHDFEETRTAHVLTKSHEILPLRYEPRADIEGLPMYRVPLEPSLHDLVDKAASQTAGSEFREEIARFLHESLDASHNFADWTARIMVRLFRGTPLVVFAPHLPAARRLAAPILEQEIRNPLQSTRLVNEMGRRLRENGYRQQIAKGADECNFFVEVESRRAKVVFQDGQYVLVEQFFQNCFRTESKPMPSSAPALEKPGYSVEEMASMLQAAPERFSANVALRCIVQQQLFPTAAYVAGPGELAYWAQLKPLFRHFGKEMPVVYPRARAVLTNAKTRQLMAKFRVDLAEISGPPDALYAKALQAEEPSPAGEIVRRRRGEIDSLLDSLGRELEAVDTSVAQMARSLRGKTASELDRLEQTTTKSDAVRVEAVRKQADRLRSTLHPLRQPQERVLNVFSFLFEYGWDLIPRIMAELDYNSFAVKEIEL